MIGISWLLALRARLDALDRDLAVGHGLRAAARRVAAAMQKREKIA